MSNVFVFGGFSESKQALEPIVDNYVANELAKDGEVFLLKEVFNDDRRIPSFAGSLAVSHSAGVIPLVDKLRSPHSELSNIHIYNPPEPRSVSELSQSATNKTARQFKATFRGPHRIGHRRLLAEGTKELPSYVNRGDIINRIANFSSVVSIAGVNPELQAKTHVILAEHDEFFKHVQSTNLWHQKTEARAYVMIDTYHDDLLVDPAGVIGSLALK